MQQRVMKQVAEAQQVKADERQLCLAKCTAVIDKLRAILLQNLGASNLKTVREPYVNINMERANPTDNYVSQSLELKTKIGPNAVIRITLHSNTPGGVKAERLLLGGSEQRVPVTTEAERCMDRISNEWYDICRPARLAEFIHVMACWTSIPVCKDFPKFKATPKKKAVRK